MKNILLMGLSTFSSGRIERWTMRDSDGKGHFYYYQMEPVIIYLTNELEKTGEKIDSIVAMVTDKASQVSDRFFADPDIVKNGRYSPVSYLNMRYPEIDITPVRIDTADMSGGIVSCARALRQINSSGEEYKLWIDNHGSLREIPMIMQGIISLLEREGIKPESVFGCETDNSGRSAKVILADESYKINDFVSGMNEFLNSGKATQLAKYLEGDDNKEIAELISDISDSILLCDMVSFDDACERLKVWLDNRSEDGSYWDLFAEYITADYGKLLDAKTSILSKIQWCLDKDYIQQALTLIESKMPDQIYNTFIICENGNAHAPVKDSQGHALNNRGNFKVSERIDFVKPNWESRSNFLVMKYGFGCVVERDSNDEAKYIDFSKNSMESVWNHMENDSFPDVSNPLNGDKVSFMLPITRAARDDAQIEVVIRYKKNVETYPAFCEFINLHMSLKNQRNNANHAVENPGETRVKASDVKFAVKTYIKLANYLGIKL